MFAKGKHFIYLLTAISLFHYFRMLLVASSSYCLVYSR